MTGGSLARRCVHSQILAIVDSEKIRPSVWAAEHGASSLERDEGEGANPGVRFRIHGRLGDTPEELEGQDEAGRDGEDLKIQLALHTEIDLADVEIENLASY